MFNDTESEILYVMGLHYTCKKEIHSVINSDTFLPVECQVILIFLFVPLCSFFKFPTVHIRYFPPTFNFEVFQNFKKLQK